MNIVALNREHDRKSFDCGDDLVNSFLHQGALQDQERRLSRTRVLVDEKNDPTRILGFYTLLISLVDQEVIPNEQPRIKRKIPVILLAQIGVDNEFQGRHFGDHLLTDAELRVVEIGSVVGVRCLMIDARTERLATWYEKRDFIRFPESLRLFKSLSTITLLVG